MPGARLKGETWYPIKCDGVSKFMVTDPEGDGRKFRDNVLEEFRKDNSTITVDCEAKKIVWDDSPYGFRERRQRSICSST
ncbi:hypothetical protein LTR66_002582 [Elasticomyces elasticus]|nr:hypothetical protein LTR50_007037 [Elasticomyces elasticus]KAK4998133.1 hypothetical protein LTR66_002582 [Elasticomyces elasticus]